MEARLLLKSIKKRKKSIKIIKNSMVLFSLVMGVSIFVIVGLLNCLGKYYCLREKSNSLYLANCDEMIDGNTSEEICEEDDILHNEMESISENNQGLAVFQFLDEYLNGEGCLIAILSCVATFYMCFQLPLMAEQSQTEFSHRIYEADSAVRVKCEEAREELEGFCRYAQKEGITGNSLQREYMKQENLVKFAYHYEYLGFMLLKNKVDFNVLFDTITYRNWLMEGEAWLMIEKYRKISLPDFWTGSEFLYRSYSVRRTCDKINRARYYKRGDFPPEIIAELISYYSPEESAFLKKNKYCSNSSRLKKKYTKNREVIFSEKLLLTKWESACKFINEYENMQSEIEKKQSEIEMNPAETERDIPFEINTLRNELANSEITSQFMEVAKYNKSVHKKEGVEAFLLELRKKADDSCQDVIVNCLNKKGKCFWMRAIKTRKAIEEKNWYACARYCGIR